MKPNDPANGQPRLPQSLYWSQFHHADGYENDPGESIDPETLPPAPKSSAPRNPRFKPESNK
jgi:hypothetical protein